jgi:hypothetical protein
VIRKEKGGGGRFRQSGGGEEEEESIPGLMKLRGQRRREKDFD